MIEGAAVEVTVEVDVGRALTVEPVEVVAGSEVVGATESLDAPEHPIVTMAINIKPALRPRNLIQPWCHLRPRPS